MKNSSRQVAGVQHLPTKKSWGNLILRRVGDRWPQGEVYTGK